jgi:hypothetical protein
VKDGVEATEIVGGGVSVWFMLCGFNWSLALVIFSRSEASIFRVSVTGKFAKSSVCIMNAKSYFISFFKK